MRPSPPLSAFVVAYNRAAIIGTCLRGLRFADEVIVVDKSSTDDTPRIAASLADRVIRVPWSPTVEDTRAFAAAQCTHEWILFLDDDECLSPATADFLRQELLAPRADAYAFPLRHYILGTHDERAYYWPEHHVRCFRRGTLRFGSTVHASLTLAEERVWRVPSDTGVCIHHLSHQDTAQWLEKANRYTERADRVRAPHAGQDLVSFAHARIDHWLSVGQDRSPGGYPSAVALLRALYDMVDRLKTWEEERGVDGAARFAAVCAALDAAYATPGPAPMAAILHAVPPMQPACSESDLLRRGLATLRAEHDAVLERMAGATAAIERRALAAERRADLAEWRANQAERRADAAAADCMTAQHAEHAAARRTDAAQAALRAIQDSTFWRGTAWLRHLVDRARSFGQLRRTLRSPTRRTDPAMQPRARG